MDLTSHASPSPVQATTANQHRQKTTISTVDVSRVCVVRQSVLGVDSIDCSSKPGRIWRYGCTCLYIFEAIYRSIFEAHDSDSNAWICVSWRAGRRKGHDCSNHFLMSTRCPLFWASTLTLALTLALRLRSEALASPNHLRVNSCEPWIGSSIENRAEFRI